MVSLSVFGEEGSDIFICDYYVPPTRPDAHELNLMQSCVQ